MLDGNSIRSLSVHNISGYLGGSGCGREAYKDLEHLSSAYYPSSRTDSSLTT